MSFCRITGTARNLPKPTYFPMLTPISPADAKKLCRITGKANDAHCFSPVISFGKTFKGDGMQGCKITKNEDFNFVKPILIKTKDNEKAYKYFEDVLQKMKDIPIRKKQIDVMRDYGYSIISQYTTIVFPPELEEGIRLGEFESINMAKDAKYINIKIKQGRIVKIDLEKLQKQDLDQYDSLYYGRGPNSDVIKENQGLLEERSKRRENTMAMKRKFEGMEQKAEEDYLKDVERPVCKRPRVKFDPNKRKEKMEKMERMLKEQEKNKALVLPKIDPVAGKDEDLAYERYLEDTVKSYSQSCSLVSCAKGYNLRDALDAQGWDLSFLPHVEWIEPNDVAGTTVHAADVVPSQEVIQLDVVVSIEAVKPAMQMSKEMTQAITKLKTNTEALLTTENVSDNIKEFKCSVVLPAFKDIDKIAETIEKARVGYMTQDSQGDATFVLKEDYIPGPGKVIAGAMVQVDGGIDKFVSGQVVTVDGQEIFVPGQTRDFEGKGLKFVLGQTVLNEKGEVKFVPGQIIKNDEEKNVFVAGQIFPTADGPRFIPGQLMSRGDGPHIFVSGQTMMTEEGPKFMPGEVTIDKWEEEVFVPGMTMPTADGEKFIAGQTFQKDGELSFTPGQIIDTVEGPAFVPGQTFETSEGSRFVQGELVMEDGNVKFERREYTIPEALKEEEPEEQVKQPKIPRIPNEQLQPLAFADRHVSGFVVNPINTQNIKTGEKLYGNMVETEENVQFYIAGKLPEDLPNDAKIIPGQLIVGETEQRFVPGKQMDTADGEAFIPGQVVFTTHGEEFVPGQVVETAEGPKFVPGQLVNTIEGEKFVPGQVIVEEEGPKFVPGQIIQTKNGATFIPGQMMTTEEGHKFVPGQLVETKDGPRFVPGQVHETADGPKFIPGTIIETEEGLRYVPPDGEEYDEEIDIIAFQGFDISPEELKLLSTNPADVQPHDVIMDERCLIDSSTLKKLADNSVPVHGRTPSPQPEKKKKKRKRAKVAIDAPDEEDKMDVVEPDEGTEKSELLKKLLKASSCVTKSKKEKEMKKLSVILGDAEHETMSAIQLDAITMLLNPSTKIGDAFKAYLGDDDELISDILMNVCETEENERNDVVVRELRTAIQGVVSAKCDQEISKIIHQLDANPENLFTDERIQILLTEAVGIVCVTGNVEVASLLEKFISEPTDPNILREDKDVVSVLRQLIVLHQIADRDPEVARCLQQLMSNPETLKDKRGIRDLLQAANFLLEKPKDAKEKQAEKAEEKFNLRHVASSKDIPTEVFEKIKEDRKEASKFLENLPDELFKAIMGDDRCGDRLMESLSSDKADRAKKDLSRFKGDMAVVVTKGDVQAVIPKEMSRSIYYGIMPYIMIDEEGFKFFEKGLTGRKLAPPQLIENNWYMPDSYYERRPLYQRTLSGEKYEMVLLGQSWQPDTSGIAASGMQYTSLLPSQGPTRISLVESSGNKPSSRGSTPRRPSMMDLSDVNHQRSSVERRINSMADFSGDSSIDLSRRRRTREPLIETNGMLPLTESYNQLAKYSSDYNDESDVGRSLVPYKSQNEDEDEEEGGFAPIGRSDTVTNLLHKYSNFSSKREFGYHKPESAYSRLMNKNNPNAAPKSKYEATIEDEEDEYGMTSMERAQMPPSKKDIIKNVQQRQKRPQQNDQLSLHDSESIVESISREGSYAPHGPSMVRDGSQIPRGVSTVREASQLPRGASTVREGSHIARGVSTVRDGSAYDNGVDLYPRDMSTIQRNFYDPYEEEEYMEGDSHYNDTGSKQPTENGKPKGLADSISSFLTRQNEREEEQMSRRRPMRSVEQLIEDELPEEEKTNFRGKFKSKGLTRVQEDDEPILVGAERDYARRTPSQLRELLEEDEPPVMSNSRTRKPMSSIQNDDDMLYSPRSTRKPYTHRNNSQLMDDNEDLPSTRSTRTPYTQKNNSRLMNDDEDLPSTRSTRKPYTQRNNSQFMEEEEDLPRINQRRSSANRYTENSLDDGYSSVRKQSGGGQDRRSMGMPQERQKAVSGRGGRQAPSQPRYSDQDAYEGGYRRQDNYGYGGQDQYGGNQDRHGSGGQDRYGGQSRFGGGQDRYGGGMDGYGGQQRGPPQERYGTPQNGQQGGYGGQQRGYGGPPDMHGAPRGAPARGSRSGSNRDRPSGPPPRRGPPQDYDDGYNQYQPRQPSYGGGNDGYGGADYGFGGSGSVVGYSSDPIMPMKNMYPGVGADDGLHPRTQERRLASKLARQYIRDEPQ